MTKMESAFATAVDWTMIIYIGLGILGVLVWMRDQTRRLIQKYRSPPESDQ